MPPPTPGSSLTIVILVSTATANFNPSPISQPLSSTAYLVKTGDIQVVGGMLIAGLAQLTEMICKLSRNPGRLRKTGGTYAVSIK